MWLDELVTVNNGNIRALIPCHDDVIKWKHFPRNWPFVRSPVHSPHIGQWRRALMFSLIYGWVNDWINNREAGDLIRHCAQYDVIVMWPCDRDHLRSHGLSFWCRLVSNWLSQFGDRKTHGVLGQLYLDQVIEAVIDSYGTINRVYMMVLSHGYAFRIQNFYSTWNTSWNFTERSMFT